MSRMGSSCSMQRSQYEASIRRRGRDGRSKSFDGNSSRSSLRHSVVCAIPDGCIANLYPVDDNYVNVNGTRRSPKSLSDLCIDAVCRNLTYLNGELPPGLPQDVVDHVVESLVQHSALNATTLRVLRNCELGSLSLAGCRGVTDAWLEPLGNSSSTTSSPALSPSVAHVDEVESMDLDEEKPSDIFYGTFESHHLDEGSACSTASFVSAAASNQDHSTEGKPIGLDNDIMFQEEQEDTKYSPIAPSPTFGSSVTNNLTLLDFRGSQRLTDRGLMHLTNLNCLEVAKLDNCHALTGRGLLAFSQSHQLHTLSLANCRRITDEAVINISHLESLEALSLDGCRCLTDRALAAISGMYGIHKLDLSQCDLLTDKGLDQLEHLENLEELSLGWCRTITDAGIKSLTEHLGRDYTLRVLRLARCSITDEGVGHLARLEVLEELDLNGCASIGSTALASALEKLRYLTALDVSYCPGIIRSGWQGKINSLKSLELCYSSVKDAHIQKFLNLSALEELNLDSCPVGNSAIAHLANRNVVPNLTSLDLADTNVTDQGMAKIAMFSKLTRLSLFYCNISNGGLRHIAKLTELEVLNLDSREISDDGLSHLKNLTKLKSLDIFSGRVTDTGCAHIAKIKSLESLELCGGGVGDLGCNLLASLDNLTSLNLSQNERITNRGAAAVATLTNLKALNLSNTRVNSHALKYFSGLLKLQSLALYGCSGIEDENVLDNLHNGLPNLKCLRLNSTSDEDGMVVADDASDDDECDDAMWLPHPSEMAEDNPNIYTDHDLLIAP